MQFYFEDYFSVCKNRMNVCVCRGFRLYVYATKRLYQMYVCIYVACASTKYERKYTYLCMYVYMEYSVIFLLSQFRDGNDRSGGDNRQSAANFARRGPWPMINLLRTSQVWVCMQCPGCLCCGNDPRSV